MNSLKKKEQFEIYDSDIRFETLVKNAPNEIAEIINETTVLILPSHGTVDSFYAGSLDTYDYLIANEIKTEIYSNDDDYKELSLHAADIWLGTFFIKNFVIPIFCSVLAAYVYDKLKANKDDNISVKFIIEKTKGEASTVSFDGKVENLEKALDAIKKFSDEN